MRRILLLSVMLLLVFTMVGCELASSLFLGAIVDEEVPIDEETQALVDSIINDVGVDLGDDEAVEAAADLIVDVLGESGGSIVDGAETFVEEQLVDENGDIDEEAVEAVSDILDAQVDNLLADLAAAVPDSPEEEALEEAIQDAALASIAVTAAGTEVGDAVDNINGAVSGVMAAFTATDENGDPDDAALEDAMDELGIDLNDDTLETDDMITDLVSALIAPATEPGVDPTPAEYEAQIANLLSVSDSFAAAGSTIGADDEVPTELASNAMLAVMSGTVNTMVDAVATDQGISEAAAIIIVAAAMSGDGVASGELDAAMAAEVAITPDAGIDVVLAEIVGDDIAAIAGEAPLMSLLAGLM